MLSLDAGDATCHTHAKRSTRGAMADRLHYEIMRKLLEIAEADNTAASAPSPKVTVPAINRTIVTGIDAPQMNHVSFPGIADVRLLPLFDSLAQLQTGTFNFNHSGENRLVAIAPPSVPPAVTPQSISPEQLLQALTMFSSHNLPESERNSIISNSDTNRSEAPNAMLPPKKRSSSLSSNHERPNKKKSCQEDRKVSVSNAVSIVSVQLSDAERRESFPLPPRNGRRPRKTKISTSDLASLSKLWDDYEMICYNMDDTVADQHAFTKRLFIQSLHQTKLCHLKDRIQPFSSNGHDPNVGVSRVLK